MCQFKSVWVDLDQFGCLILPFWVSLICFGSFGSVWILFRDVLACFCSFYVVLDQFGWFWVSFCVILSGLGCFGLAHFGPVCILFWVEKGYLGLFCVVLSQSGFHFGTFWLALARFMLVRISLVHFGLVSVLFCLFWGCLGLFWPVAWLSIGS